MNNNFNNRFRYQNNMVHRSTSKQQRDYLWCHMSSVLSPCSLAWRTRAMSPSNCSMTLSFSFSVILELLTRICKLLLWFCSLAATVSAAACFLSRFCSARCLLRARRSSRDCDIHRLCCTRHIRITFKQGQENVEKNENFQSTYTKNADDVDEWGVLRIERYWGPSETERWELGSFLTLRNKFAQNYCCNIEERERARAGEGERGTERVTQRIERSWTPSNTPRTEWRWVLSATKY